MICLTLDLPAVSVIMRISEGKYADRFDFHLVDEYQDTNQVQMKYRDATL